MPNPRAGGSLGERHVAQKWGPKSENGQKAKKGDHRPKRRAEDREDGVGAGLRGMWRMRRVHLVIRLPKRASHTCLCIASFWGLQRHGRTTKSPISSRSNRQGPAQGPTGHALYDLRSLFFYVSVSEYAFTTYSVCFETKAWMKTAQDAWKGSDNIGERLGESTETGPRNLTMGKRGEKHWRASEHRSIREH